MQAFQAFAMAIDWVIWKFGELDAIIQKADDWVLDLFKNGVSFGDVRKAFGNLQESIPVVGPLLRDLRGGGTAGIGGGAGQSSVKIEQTINPPAGTSSAEVADQAATKAARAVADQQNRAAMRVFREEVPAT